MSGAVETVETVIDLRDYLPAGVVLAEEGFDGNISVSDIRIRPDIARKTGYVNFGLRPGDL